MILYPPRNFIGYAYVNKPLLRPYINSWDLDKVNLLAVKFKYLTRTGNI